MINPGRLMAAATIVLLLSMITAGGAFAAPVFQLSEERGGVFGTVSAILDDSLVLDGEKIVATDSNTRVLVPGAEEASLEDISIGDRLAVVAEAHEDGGIVAIDIMVTPPQPVNNDHVVGVVTNTENGVITVTDNDGNSVDVEVPDTAEIKIGDFLTIVSDKGSETENRSARAIAEIDHVINRLTEDIEAATDRATMRLQELLEDNGDGHLTALSKVLEKTSQQAREALERAFEQAQLELEETLAELGANSPGIRVRGFVRGLVIEQAIGVIAIDSIDDGVVILKITGETDLAEGVEEGSFVKASYNRGQLASRITLDDDSVVFRGVIQRLSDTAFLLEDIEFQIVEETEIQGMLEAGASVQVKGVHEGKELVAVAVEVMGVDEEEGDPDKIEFLGVVTVVLSDQEVEIEGHAVVITPDTEIDGRLVEGALVKIQGEISDGSLIVKEIRMLEVGSDDVRFRGVVTGILSEGDIEVDGRIVRITEDTEIEGDLALGAQAKIEGIRDGLTVIASAIDVKAQEELEREVEFAGTITEIFDTGLKVDGLTVRLAPDSNVAETLYLGARVRVEAVMTEDGLVAAEIVIEELEGDEDDAPLDVGDA